MLKLVLYFSKIFYRERCSLQREMLNRLQKKRGARDEGHDELLEAYEYLDALVKKLHGVGKIKTKEYVFLIKHPVSALNFLSGRKIPFNDLEKFRSELVRNKG